MNLVFTKTVSCKPFFSLLPLLPHPLFYPLKAVLRYLRTDKRMSSVTFNNLVLADGQKHRLLFHLKGMQPQGPGGVELHLDCRLVETVRDLPAAFQGLPAGYGLVELRTMQAREQVINDLQYFCIIMFCQFLLPTVKTQLFISNCFILTGEPR